MALKKSYFYKVVLTDDTKTKKPVTEIKRIFKEVIATKATNDHLVLVERNIDNAQVVMDILINNDQYLYCRLGKEKEINSFLERDKISLDASDLSIGANKIIEMYTHVYLNYTTGILVIVKNNSAPQIKTLNNIVPMYNINLKTEFVPIPNDQSINSLYKPNSAISAVTFDVPVPTADYLEGVLKFNRGLIRSFRNTEVRNMRITLFNEPRKRLTSEIENIKEIVSNLIQSKDDNTIIAGKVKGNPGQSLSQEYDLFSELFSYNINVNTYRVENHERVYNTVDELNDIIKNELIASYNHNISHLEQLADRV